MESVMPKMIVVFVSGLILCVPLLSLLYYLLPHNFLKAQKNARSNHTIPARQIGGIALVPTILILLGFFYSYIGLSGRAVVLLETSGWLLWLIGLLDDRYDISVRLRLGVQLISAALGIAALGYETPFLPFMPLWLDRGLLVLVMLYWINVTNFMDGLDLMTVSGLGIPVLWISIFAALGLTEGSSGYFSALIAGALLGFAFFNCHPAKVFLGDSGSLPLGMLSCFVFLSFARDTSIWLALILPLYYVLDASSTIVMRLFENENIFEAHSRHAYQKARRTGRSVWAIIRTVVFLNVALGIGVFFALMKPQLWIELAVCLAALLATSSLLLKLRTTSL
ncbi:glycoside hydrolase [Paenochrobactrum pullorum]|uniref:glycoside hydrolase n=1 Tax=Paenochrobactrum pullorum TaxID=1324351 RepID=UPI0035BBB925